MASDVPPPRARSRGARGRNRRSSERWEERQPDRWDRDVARAERQWEASRARLARAEARGGHWSAPGPSDGCGPDAAHGRGRRRRSPAERLASDIVRASLLGVFLVIISTHAASTDDGRALDAVAYGLLVAESISFVWWRRRPWFHWAVALGVNTAWYWIGYANGPVMVPLLFAVLGVASTRSSRSGLLAAAGPPAVLAAAMIGGGNVDLAVTLIVSGWTVAVLVAGRMSQAMRERRVAWSEWAASQHREEEAAKRRDADEERMRIAREVHDVVSHNLAVIRVQASVALHLLDTDKRPEQAREALVAIKQSSADALADLRSTLDVLRNPDDASGEPRTPGRSATLADLTALVANAETAGLPVDLTVRGPVDGLPDELGLAGYRVVQEAITNVLRHAGPARATVLVDGTSSGRLVIEVRDDGVGAPVGADGEVPTGPWGGGHGVTGMRERVEALGGTFDAGPVPDSGGGGFRVRADLPVPAPPADSGDEADRAELDADADVDADAGADADADAGASR